MCALYNCASVLASKSQTSQACLLVWDSKVTVWKAYKCYITDTFHHKAMRRVMSGWHYRAPTDVVQCRNRIVLEQSRCKVER